MQQGRFLAAHVGPGTDAQLHGKARQQPPGLSGGDGGAQPLNGQGVFGPHVNKTLAGPHGMGCNRHALQQPVGIALQHGPVHEGTRVALIGVTHDHLAAARLSRHQLPFAACGVAGPAAAPQPAALQFLHHGFRCQLAAGGEGGVGAFGKGVFEAARVHQATALQHHGSLQGEEGMLRIQLALSGHAAKQLDAAIVVVGGG